ncbi:MAG: isocitrate lyase/phosphoenolpyruvate mutase family protein [Solirubrobacterales bacterium]
MTSNGPAGTPKELKTTRLRRMLSAPRLTRVVGASDGLSAKLAERHGFDALWASGFAISTAHGVPDASILTMTEYLAAAQVMNSTTSLPVVADCDTGFGDVANVMRMVHEYERAGIAAVCIEDKVFPKRNSFTADNKLLPVEEFAAKVRAAKYAQVDEEFLVIARIESLIAGMPMEDALERADTYRNYGADAILIHSKATSAEEVLHFAAEWNSQPDPLPLVAVPTTYYSVTTEELEAAGFSMVIYANHAMRAAWGAINQAFKRIRGSDGIASLEEELPRVTDVLDFSGINELEQLADSMSTPPPLAP